MTTAVKKAPQITQRDAELLAADLYGLDVSAAPATERTRPELCVEECVR